MEECAIIQMAKPFKAGTPKVLFHVPATFPLSTVPGEAADVSIDGKRFALILTPQ